MPLETKEEKEGDLGLPKIVTKRSRIGQAEARELKKSQELLNKSTKDSPLVGTKRPIAKAM